MVSSLWSWSKAKAKAKAKLKNKNHLMMLASEKSSMKTELPQKNVFKQKKLGGNNSSSINENNNNNNDNNNNNNGNNGNNDNDGDNEYVEMNYGINSGRAHYKKNDDAQYLRDLSLRLLFDIDNVENSMNGTSAIMHTTEYHKLPSLTSSNELDIRLYGLISLLLKNFVFGWYNDKLDLQARDEFTQELIYLIAHICRNLQERINVANDDFVKLLITDIPYLLLKHLQSLEDIKCLIIKNNDEDEDEDDISDEIIDKWISRYSDGLGDEVTNLAYRRLLIKTIVCLVLPHENVDSRISREFFISLIDDIVLRNILDSLCESFVIWDIIGKLCLGLSDSTESSTNNLKTEKENDSGTYLKIYKLLRLFIVDEKYDIKGKNRLEFKDFVPMLDLINYISLINLRFPILMTIATITLQLILQISIFSRFFNGFIKKLIFANALKCDNLVKSVDFLRHMMFPFDDEFSMKPRYVPQNDYELQEIHDINLKHLETFMMSDSKLAGFFLSKSDQKDTQLVEKKCRNILSLFRYKQINRIFLQRLLDVVLSFLFPELQVAGSQIIFDTYKVQ